VIGIDIDIIKEMGRRLNIKLNIELFPWQRLIKMTKLGNCDGSMALFHSAEREEFALYTYPVHHSTYVIFVKKEKAFDFSSIHDLFGRQLAVQSGFIISDEFDQAVKNKQINRIDVYKLHDSMKRTNIGWIDGFIANKHVILYKLKAEEKLKQFRGKFLSLPKPVKAERPAYFVLSKAAKIKDKANLQQQITKTMEAMNKEGVYNKILDNHLK